MTENDPNEMNGCGHMLDEVASIAQEAVEQISNLFNPFS